MQRELRAKVHNFPLAGSEIRELGQINRPFDTRLRESRCLKQMFQHAFVADIGPGFNARQINRQDNLTVFIDAA